MKILIEPQIFNLQKFGGISRYFTELYRYGKQKKDIQIDISLCYSENLHLKNYGYKHLSILYKYSYVGKRKILEIINKLSYNRTISILLKKKCDLFIPTYYDTYYLPYLKNTPFVLTVHDMINELFPQYFSIADPIPNIKKELIEKATKIIAISENTKNDIIKIHPHINPTKIEVIHHGFYLNKNFYKFNNERYVLFIGNRKGYKNFDWMIRSIKSILIKNNIKCYCVGGGSFTNQEISDFKNLKIQHLLLHFDVDDKLLYSFYKNAIVFIFPSIYEGFGIPILESFFSDCPVILPFTSCFPEVAGDAGIYYNINDHQSLILGLSKVINDISFRTYHVDKGKSQLNNFSWTKTMEKTFKIYQNIYFEKK